MDRSLIYGKPLKIIIFINSDSTELEIKTLLQARLECQYLMKHTTYIMCNNIILYEHNLNLKILISLFFFYKVIISELNYLK